MHINTLELADNHIQAEGAKYLVEMLRANFTIQHLVCQNANLPLEGTSGLQVTFYLSFTVSSLYQHLFCFQDLSNNCLQSAGAECVAKILLDNISLKSMKLSGIVHTSSIELLADVLKPG